MIVIKLKQVEHVRNERKTLADVSGHPFITTLIASFSDDQNLYMLVRSLDPSVFLPRATNPHPRVVKPVALSRWKTNVVIVGLLPWRRNI